MGEFHCDRCGVSLLVRDEVRYKLKIEVASVYDTLEMSSPAVAALDMSAAIAEAVRACEGRSAEELEQEVYACFEFDLCARCQKAYVKDPLGHKREP